MIADPTKIPFNEADLDPEIRDLCRVINSSFLFRTTSSCAGHHIPDQKRGQAGMDSAYVVFVPVSSELQARQRFLERIVTATKGKPWWCEITATYTGDADGNMQETYMLSLQQMAWRTPRLIEAKKQALVELPRLIRQGNTQTSD